MLPVDEVQIKGLRMKDIGLFVSLLLMVWGGLRLVVTIFLRVAIILRYRGCGVYCFLGNTVPTGCTAL
jgi:hypothetical protein